MRKTSHTQNPEPFLEYFLSWYRSKKAAKYVKRGGVVADLGCGYRGIFLKRISTKIKRGVGYDVSVTKVDLPQNIILQKANLNKKINVHKNDFDTVTALAVLEHVENPKIFLNQIKSMLKRDGEVIITTPHRRSKHILEFLSRNIGLISKEEIEDHKNYFDEKLMRKLLNQEGFKITRLNTFELGLNLLCVAKKVT